jgi:hypothetical protein
MYRFEAGSRGKLFGHGDGDFIRLRDEHGNEWRGMAEYLNEDVVRYRFRDAHGNYATGITDREGIILRDDKGNIWRGFAD